MLKGILPFYAFAKFFRFQIFFINSFGFPFPENHWDVPFRKNDERNPILKYQAWMNIWWVESDAKISKFNKKLSKMSSILTSNQLLNFLRSLTTILSKSYQKYYYHGWKVLVLVITCLGGRFGINYPNAYLKILKTTGYWLITPNQTNKHFVLKLIYFNIGQLQTIKQVLTN